MKFSRLTLSFASALLFVVGVVAHAQQHEVKTAKVNTSSSSVQLGNKVIVIPAPEGYEEATAQFKQIKDRFSATEAPENDMLLVHLPLTDCELLRQGSNATYVQYTKISVLRAARSLNVTSAIMTLAVEELRKSAPAFLDPNSPELQKIQRQVSRGLSQADAKETKVDFGKPVMLGEFNVKPDLFSMLLLLTVKGTVGGVAVTTPMLLSVSYVRVKERLIFVYAYRKFDSKVDVEPLKLFTEKWTGSIIAANVTK
ncbi:MAG: hypothetical protein LC794_13115 [Acidobacteria bacterium]|nr:hypothetical protein [Acidobacteriota bacterium]MCA1627611.1 hypothetical protein [Acidobacteriota bacterium]